MQRLALVRNSIFYFFIVTLLCSIALYVYSYIFSKSGATGLRLFFTLFTISMGCLAQFCCLQVYGTKYNLFSIAGTIFVSGTMLLCLFAIWYRASFLASNWMMIEISIVVSVFISIISVVLKWMSSGK